MILWYELQSICLRHSTYKVLASFFYLISSAIVRILIKQKRHAVCELSTDEVSNTPKDDCSVLIPPKRAYLLHNWKEDLRLILFS